MKQIPAWVREMDDETALAEAEAKTKAKEAAASTPSNAIATMPASEAIN